MAPMANILLVTTPTAETLGVQGFPQMMNAEQYVVDHHLAQVISQSFGSAEDAFGSAQSLRTCAHAFMSAAENGVTVLGSSGDSGTANDQEDAGRQGRITDPVPDRRVAGLRPARHGRRRHVPVHRPEQRRRPRSPTAPSPPAKCAARSTRRGRGRLDVLGRRLQPRVRASRPTRTRLPAGSTAIGSMRGVPDVALQASARHGRAGLPHAAARRPERPDLRRTPCSTGWYDIGGTSLSAPQWAGLAAIGAQMKGHAARSTRPFSVASNPRSTPPTSTTWRPGTKPGRPVSSGLPRHEGWDPVTGLGTPNAANLLPDLVALVP